MNQRFLKFLQYFVFGLDLAALNGVVLFFYLLMDRTDGVVVGYIRFWMWLNIGWLLVSRMTELYAGKEIGGFERFVRTTLRSYMYWLGVVMVYLFFMRAFELSRLYIIMVLTGTGTLFLINRFLYLGLQQRLQQKQRLLRRVLILGFNDTAQRLAGYLEEDRRNIRIVGFCEEAHNVRQLSHYPILGPVAETLAHCETHQVNEIYSTIAPEHDPGIYALMQQADHACIGFRVVPDMSLFLRRQVHVEFLQDLPLLSLRREPLQDAANRARKRIFDIVVSSAVIVFILSWLVPLVALLIKLESKGPVFFRQFRTGRSRKAFPCLKFRSMRVNSESDLRQASRNDDRLTRVGRFLRKTNIDEFPQFFNVLKGEMSIVGPRPHMLKHTDDYSALIDGYMVRQFLKPGITGWAQVQGYRGETTRVEQMERRVACDVWYGENWSLMLDLKIIWLTVWLMVRGDRNAY